jgi:hypothetical protein
MPVATHGATNRYAVPATVSTSRISCVAYVTEDRASLAKIGNAIRFDSAVSFRRSLLTGRPITSRLATLVSNDTHPAYGPGCGLAGGGRGDSAQSDRGTFRTCTSS